MKLILSEEQYNRLLLEADMLLEADRRNVITGTLKFNQDWADEFHGMTDKLSVWVADAFLKKIMEETGKSKDDAVDFINRRGIRMHEWSGIYKANFSHILDWIRGSGGSVNLRELNYDEAHRRAEEWHDSLTTEVEPDFEEDSEVFIDYRNSRGVGFYWANLGKSYCDREHDRMGHCARASHGVLYSLRGINERGEGESYVTAAYDNGIIYDFKSRGNSKPPARYHRYIMDFLANKIHPVNRLSKDGVYQYQTNFHLADLTDEQRKWVFDRNPSLRFNIEDKATWPEIIEAILNDDLDINAYSFPIRLALIKFSNSNPDLISLVNINDEQLIEMFNETTNYLPKQDAKDSFINIYGDRLVALLSGDKFEQIFPSTVEFTKFLRLVSMEYVNIYQRFCSVIDKGFRKWEDRIADLLSTPKLRKKILQCTDVVDMLNQYADFQAFDVEGNALVRMDDESGYWGLINARNEFLIQPDYVALSYSPMDRDKLVFIGKTRENDFYKINLRTGETKKLANR